MYKDKIDFFLEQIYNKCLEKKADNIAFALGSNYYSLHYNQNVSLDEIENLIELASSDEHYSFSSGTLGVVYFMKLLHSADIISDEDIESIEEDSIDFLLELTNLCVDKNEYDLFTGLIGLGIYFLEIKRLDIVSKIVSYIDQIKYENSDSYYWIDNITKEENICDLGLAHGLPSIIFFLSDCYLNNCERDLCKNLINGASKYLIQLYEENKSADHIFPSKINVVSGQKYPSNRLAWCYGDLSVAICLWKAYSVLNNEFLREISLKILLNSSKIRFENSGIFFSNSKMHIDTGFCHGTSGVAHIFNKFYRIIDIPELKEASQYWMKLTINELEKGAKFPLNIREDTWTEHPGLLEGISGVGMVLLDYQHPQKAKNWDKIYLMNI
ncbi:hypothetical protein MKJ01_01900 [Chryseobacterium sp. SSA4.19]|uniref:lanthionine synthetase LanC family protein n=1 Tax=Chryseobacterium sp. SSA4.19 TaxID=2919915 RepID=UPI001F4E497C|nr:lanthionine synthetase LanC family protein [Chryseobacterium sp. SSA4.19]MCJ8152511.1 hypothetical protein [Chryseobacterium sp. SSA4.19]